MLNVEAFLRNSDADWNAFSSHDYWRRNYSRLQAEDREIIRRVSHFLISAFTNPERPRAQRAIDVGSGTNLYPALLMLPWTERILLAEYAPPNIEWLRKKLLDEDTAWDWAPFWHELRGEAGYRDIERPRERLREACFSDQGHSGIERLSVFDLPRKQWDLGTMFFVAESITEDPAEFRAAVERFIGALTDRAPFAAAFMAGSDGYAVADTDFPALPIDLASIGQHLTDLGATDLSVTSLSTEDRVRDGYAGMIVATGYAGSR